MMMVDMGMGMVCLCQTQLYKIIILIAMVFAQRHHNSHNIYKTHIFTMRIRALERIQLDSISSNRINIYSNHVLHLVRLS